MGRLLTMASAVFLLAVFLYGAAAFVEGSLTPYYWPRESRNFVAGASLLLSPFAAMFGAWAYSDSRP